MCVLSMHNRKITKTEFRHIKMPSELEKDTRYKFDEQNALTVARKHGIRSIQMGITSRPNVRHLVKNNTRTYTVGDFNKTQLD